MAMHAIGAIAASLKLAANTAVFVFLIWSTFFATTTNFGLWRGILAFVALTMFLGLVGMVPFGTTFAPLLFEWWWHDVPLWKFSAGAWSVTAFSIVANILVLITIFGSQSENAALKSARE
jgi:hypothetical protein